MRTAILESNRIIRISSKVHLQWKGTPLGTSGVAQKIRATPQNSTQQQMCAESPLAAAPESSRKLSPTSNQNITFPANQNCRSPPVPDPRPARFNVPVMTPKLAVFVTSVPGLP